MDRRRFTTTLAATAAGLALPLPLMAQSRPNPSGTVDIDETQVALLIGGSFGGGTLNFGGRSYKFTIGGLGVGGIGVSRVQATGHAYNLKEIWQFPGVYGSARIGWAAGQSGDGSLWLQNPHDVVLELKTKRQGLALTAGVDGIYIEMKS